MLDSQIKQKSNFLEKFTNFEQVNNYILKKISDLNALNIGEHKLKKFKLENIYLSLELLTQKYY